MKKQTVHLGFEVLMNRPELVVEVERKVVTVDGTSLKGRVARLMAQGFFAEAKAHSATRRELERTGAQINSGNLSTLLSAFVAEGFLTREGSEFRLAPGVKVSERELTVA